MIVQAPWTPSQVEKLRQWQGAGWVHPFTCGGNHASDQTERRLTPSPDGWFCWSCGWTQNWCHDFMLNGPGDNPFKAFV